MWGRLWSLWAGGKIIDPALRRLIQQQSERQVAGGEQDRKKAGGSAGQGGAPVEEVPGPELEEVVKMEPLDQMSEGEGGRRTQIQEQPQKENASNKMTP